MTGLVYLSIANPSGIWLVQNEFADSVENELRNMSAQEYGDRRKTIIEAKEEKWRKIQGKMHDSKEKRGSYFADTVDENGILSLDLRGEISEYASSWSGSGIVLSDLNGVLEMIDEEADTKDQSVKGIFMRINSPGGIAIPSLNTGEHVYELNKKVPIISYYSGLAASAAIALTAGSSGILCSPGAIVGGVACVLRTRDVADDPKMYRRIALASGKKKIETEERGEDGFLTEAALSAKQKEVNTIGAQFADLVSRGRKLDEEKKAAISEGGYYIGGQAAVKSGLADKVALPVAARAYATRAILKANKERMGK